MIIAVDYDGTIEKDGKIDRFLITRLIRAQRSGDTVILWTSRIGEGLKEAVINCHRAGFKPNYVNQNAPEILKKVGDPRKIIADYYIDDKAIRA